MSLCFYDKIKLYKSDILYLISKLFVSAELSIQLCNYISSLVFKKKSYGCD